MDSYPCWKNINKTIEFVMVIIGVVLDLMETVICYLLLVACYVYVDTIMDQ